LLRAFETPADGIRSFKRVLRVDPNHVEALVWVTIVTAAAWSPDAARAYAQAVRAIDPFHPMVDYLDGCVLMFRGDFEQATRNLQESLRSARLPLVLWCLALNLAYLGRREEACSLLEEAFSGDEGSVSYRMCRLCYHILRNERESAWHILRSDLDTSAATHRDFIYALLLAEYHSVLGDMVGALDWLERSVALGCINYPFLGQYDPFLANLRGEERFKKLMERVKKEWEEFEV
jgi:tetratricopeptide (TPR) repeat protein